MTTPMERLSAAFSGASRDAWAEWANTPAFAGTGFQKGTGMDEDERPDDGSGEPVGSVGPETIVEGQRVRVGSGAYEPDAISRLNVGAVEDDDVEARGDDAERVPGTRDAAGLLEVTRWIFNEAPLWVDLSCGHDLIMGKDDGRPRSLGDMVWCMGRCDENAMVVGLSFMDMDAPAFDLLRRMIAALNQ